MTKRTQTWIALALAAVGLIPVAVLGLFTYMKLTATPLHPTAKDVQSSTQASPGAKWARSVEQARTFVRADVADRNLPGLSVAVGVAGDLVWAEGFGWADLEAKTPVSPTTRFRIGGTSIAISSVAAGLLVDKGKLKLDDKIQTYVPSFPDKQWPVTLRQLMGHLGGIRGDNGDEESMEGCERTIDGLSRFADAPLRSEPGTAFRYSSYGWILVSAAIEAAADEPFFTFVRTHILEPLKMLDTRIDSVREPNPTRATFYYPKFAAEPRYGPDPARDGDYSCFAGAGGFLSTPSDLVRFGMAINDGKLLQQSTLKLLQAAQRGSSGAETGYGLGWDLETMTLGGVTSSTVGHDSESVIGGSTTFRIIPEHNLVVAVTTNISFADTTAIAGRVAEFFVQQHNGGTTR